jgi:hypothetical protein
MATAGADIASAAMAADAIEADSTAIVDLRAAVIPARADAADPRHMRIMAVAAFMAHRQVVAEADNFTAAASPMAAKFAAVVSRMVMVASSMVEEAVNPTVVAAKPMAVVNRMVVAAVNRAAAGSITKHPATDEIPEQRSLPASLLFTLNRRRLFSAQSAG